MGFPGHGRLRAVDPKGNLGLWEGPPQFPWSSNIPQGGNGTSRSPVAKWRTLPCWMLSGRSCGKEWNWG